MHRSHVPTLSCHTCPGYKEMTKLQNVFAESANNVLDDKGIQFEQAGSSFDTAA
jgi:hypothetical protein